MRSYIVIKPFRAEDGRDLESGDRIKLTARQAKYLLLGGKLKRPTVRKKKPENKGD